ncbi:major facilitator transporter [Thermoclostridium stercorarium subsp. stercorarium DSM 8532]|jgi:PPP family 3-phenylpropionic acid transporter|uniref:Major facilitator transporter n=3 Tax=Thermoclostridium stercorarium TaxID=1510 RepID=L7VMS3_THES1|nr:MFS transporter [Thermoclostridium stercorarium]AGC68042.1 major facilitator transporter [Thermoclostridium stercorarium subsp. stercorarium DSM 8532]AGI39073.1 major facilitator superfamily protein [Thermoclostridium stercorarium subsp. stercorarium DSM 8532]ANW98434.1 MFS transporter [Thermoclostridium stercorarium subsp. thermolacticum DSM 2910]ANX00971.1 MFS transporter [Thermoclostridium stercorarium subsp. leptospartum DSM 9219]UZQ86578.1 MFS transporter [Thermoclostridium stercorariu
MDASKFPTRFFLLYILYYSGQAVYSVYFNLYLSGIGFSNTMIGLLVSLSTLLLLIAQPFWGLMSDRAKYKNTVLTMLFLFSGLSALMYYFSTGYLYVIIISLFFTAFYSAVSPLQDNLTLEYLENKKWDFGKIRMGGTLGYSVAAVLSGIMLKGRYSNIFWIVSLFLLLCFALMFTIPSVPGGRRKNERVPVGCILKNKTLMCLIGFNLSYSLGLSFFYTYYPIYFESINGNSSYTGILIFTCAIAEIPFMMIIDKILKKFGMIKLLISAAAVSGIRWLLMYFLTNPVLIILANLMHGFSFTCFTYSILTYINVNTPKSLKATAQTLNSMVSAFFSKVVFGILGGVASDIFGINKIMLVSSVITFIATFIFGSLLIKLGEKNEAVTLS